MVYTAKFYEFERRAIFSKRWLLITHRVRVPEIGSYIKFQTAGYDFFLVKNRRGEIQAFHNVCRHRAYPIFDKEQPQEGERSILSCGYHGKPNKLFHYAQLGIYNSLLGWSFGLDGKLAKAPNFDEVETFNKEEYSLFKIHTYVDKLGFIWINFDASENPTPWEEMNGGSDEQPRLQGFDLDKYVHDHTWIAHGEYNWKLVGENYNEVGHRKQLFALTVPNILECFTDWQLTSVTTARPVIPALPKLPISTSTLWSQRRVAWNMMLLTRTILLLVTLNSLEMLLSRGTTPVARQILQHRSSISFV